MPTPKEYQAMLEGGCPHCGEALVIKQGKYGEFITCQEWCGYTKSISGRSEYPPRKLRKASCPYNKCDGSGLIPFKRKDGSISPHTKLHCDCHHTYGVGIQDRYVDAMVADFDFPMSDTFRAYSYQYCGQPDPGYIPPEPEAPLPQVIEHRHSDMSKKDYALLQNLEGQVKYLQGKLTEREKKKEDYY